MSVSPYKAIHITHVHTQYSHCRQHVSSQISAYKMVPLEVNVDYDSCLNFDNVLDLCHMNKNPTDFGHLVASGGQTLVNKLEVYQKQISTISGFAHLYDSKTGIQANGFRSFIKVNHYNKVVIIVRGAIRRGP